MSNPATNQFGENYNDIYGGGNRSVQSLRPADEIDQGQQFSAEAIKRIVESDNYPLQLAVEACTDEQLAQLSSVHSDLSRSQNVKEFPWVKRFTDYCLAKSEPGKHLSQEKRDSAIYWGRQRDGAITILNSSLLAAQYPVSDGTPWQARLGHWFRDKFGVAEEEILAEMKEVNDGYEGSLSDAHEYQKEDDIKLVGSVDSEPQNLVGDSRYWPGEKIPGTSMTDLYDKVADAWTSVSGYIDKEGYIRGTRHRVSRTLSPAFMGDLMDARQREFSQRGVTASMLSLLPLNQDEAIASTGFLYGELKKREQAGQA